MSQFKISVFATAAFLPFILALGFRSAGQRLKKYLSNWGLEVLQQQPGLTMGLPPEFFLLACAFVEVSLGILLIIGLLQRPLA